MKCHEVGIVLMKLVLCLFMENELVAVITTDNYPFGETIATLTVPCLHMKNEYSGLITMHLVLQDAGIGKIKTQLHKIAHSLCRNVGIM